MIDSIERAWDQLQYARRQFEFWKGEQLKPAGLLSPFADAQSVYWAREVLKFSRFFMEESKDAKGKSEVESM